jgi:hypothetical protein
MLLNETLKEAVAGPLPTRNSAGHADSGLLFAGALGFTHYNEDLERCPAAALRLSGDLQGRGRTHIPTSENDLY